MMEHGVKIDDQLLLLINFNFLILIQALTYFKLAPYFCPKINLVNNYGFKPTIRGLMFPLIGIILIIIRTIFEGY